VAVEFLLEPLLQFIGEFVLQILFESAVQLGLARFQSSRRQQLHPLIALFGFLAWGMVAGGISLWPFPDSFVVDHNLRITNLLVTPLAAGGFAALLGAWRKRRGRFLIRLDLFRYAYAFAAGMALIRYLFAG
jgi:hypothetical protein